MQLTTLAGRLHRASICTSVNLYDLTKAFDTLSTVSILQNMQSDCNVRPTIRAMLSDLQRRLCIHMSVGGGEHLFVKLGDGVLQGGSVGPWLFRRVYDHILQDKLFEDNLNDSLTSFVCEGAERQLAAAAFADDLAKVEAAHQADAVETKTLERIQSLKHRLAAHILTLHMKCELLLAVRGKGAYAASRKMHSGEWRGPELKEAVKYLGAFIRRDGSLTLEISRRIASAKGAFATLARLFRRSEVPLRVKVLVFKAVVNETLFSALEVRVLTSTHVARLESVRGLPLRKLFGQHGYGLVRGRTVLQ